MLTRLNFLCADYDRTAQMGPFPTDPSIDSGFGSEEMLTMDKGSLLWSNKTGYFIKSFFKFYWRHIADSHSLLYLPDRRCEKE